MQQENLQEFYNLLKDEFPKLSDSCIYKILFCLLERLKKHGNNIWFSRYEGKKFWISEKKLRNVIEYLRDIWILELSHTTISTNEKRLINKEIHKCNVYRISDCFVDMILSFQRFVKKTFKYIDPIVFMQKHFRYLEKTRYFKFKHNWNHYIINKMGKYKGVIYCWESNTIVSPLSLLL